ncbi:MAG: hypothetical protein JWM14_1967 [Chitinophagaceae bacterium]|nr:hypothetical protein [Chitinophagaceae bacterium]
MANKIITAKDVEKAEKQIKELQIPYEYDTKEYPIEVLLHKFKSDDPESSTIVIPGYQRDFIWKDKEKARFIESLLLGVPIQPLFAAVIDEDGSLELIDGSQRLRTIDAFMHDEFKLSALKKLSDLNGLKFSDFIQARKNKFSLISLRVHVITEKASLSIRQDIFDRINTSGQAAKDSEVRKGAHSGKFYNFVIECANNPLFNKLCPISTQAKKRGEAEELILRYFTYSTYGTERKERGRKILDMFLIDQNEKGFNKATKKKEFLDMLKFIQDNFPMGFRKNPNSNSTPRVRFEALSLGAHFALKTNPNLKVTSLEWLNSKEFDEVTTSDASNNQGRLSKRVHFVKDCLLNKIKINTLSYETN